MSETIKSVTTSASLPSKEEYKNFETYCLVWLDGSVNDSKEYLDAQQRLRSSINYLRTFSDPDQCQLFIQSVPSDDRIILIVNYRLGQQFLSQVHQLRQITSVYVFCNDNKRDEQWTKQFNKIEGVLTQLDVLVSQIRSERARRSHNKFDEPLSISILNVNVDNRLNGEFIRSHLLIECLQKIKENQNDLNQLMDLCKQEYNQNKVELSIIREFEENYSKTKVLRWLTRQSFLYRILNKALRTLNTELLFLFRFIIRDIEEQLNKHLCSLPIRLYRGQIMTNEQLEKLTNGKDDFLLFKTFLSTTMDRDVALAFLDDQDKSEMKKVLFEIDADPKIEGIKPFANITWLSYFPGQQEVLFMIGSIFKIVDIEQDNNQLTKIRLVLSSDNNPQLKEIFKGMKKEFDNGEIDLFSFGQVLCDVGNLDDAKTFYRHLLSDLPTDDQDLAQCYNALAYVAENKGDLNSSLEWNQKLFHLLKDTFKEEDHRLGSTLYSIGNIFLKMNDLKQAMEYFNKALNIYKKTLGEDDLKIALCSNSIGQINEKEKKYFQALNYYQKALEINQKSLPVNHPDIGYSHSKIASVRLFLCHYYLALEHYNLAIKIKSASLSPEHIDIAKDYYGIGNVYKKKGEPKQAIQHYQKAANMYRQILPPTHPELINLEEIIRSI